MIQEQPKYNVGRIAYAVWAAERLLTIRDTLYVIRTTATAGGRG